MDQEKNGIDRKERWIERGMTELIGGESRWRAIGAGLELQGCGPL